MILFIISIRNVYKMLTKTQLKILGYLIDNKERLVGIRELAKEISSVYYLVQKNIQQLKDMNVISLQKAGRTSIIKINEESEASYLIEAEQFKRREFYKTFPEIKVALNKIIRETSFSFFAVLVFGSYAKSPVNLRKGSDLDLLVIVPDKKYEDSIQKAISSVSRTSLIKIHEIILTEDSFKSQLSKKELNVSTEAKDKHILIYGGEDYYKIIR